uniref:Uncharacterized protein n=1 Tax=Glossina pallidipes TaxID=7398 RepID=A0A1A9ZMX6_GLOPL
MTNSVIKHVKAMQMKDEIEEGWYEDNWYEVNLDNEGITCTVEQMRMAAEGHLTTEALMWNQNNQTTISGMTAEEFRLRLNHALIEEGYDINHDRYPEGYQEAPLAYDAVWSVALAFNKTMERLKRRNKSLKEFTYNDKDIADEIYAAMNSTQFLGVSHLARCEAYKAEVWCYERKQKVMQQFSGLLNENNPNKCPQVPGVVAFSSQGDRIALTQIEQMINGRYEKLGYYDTQLDNLTWLNMEQWIGGKVNINGRNDLQKIPVILNVREWLYSQQTTTQKTVKLFASDTSLSSVKRKIKIITSDKSVNSIVADVSGSRVCPRGFYRKRFGQKVAKVWATACILQAAANIEVRTFSVALTPALAKEIVCCYIASCMATWPPGSILSNSSMQHMPLSANISATVSITKSKLSSSRTTAAVN